MKRKGVISNKNGVRLFLLTLPFLIATFIFCYMPLFGWRYAFFDYKAGFSLMDCKFVGFKHFLEPFSNAIVREDLIRVLKNTFAMSLLGILASPLPMLFAIFLSEIRLHKCRKIVQTVTTIPNFISWVLVFSLAYSLFAVDGGLVNNILKALGLSEHGINFLASQDHVWVTMWLVGIWKSLGWSAIMYISALSSVDVGMYEAAEIDGAGRFQKIWYLTIPSLLPTFFVLLLLSIANFLNNGMDQYFVFQNAMNKEHIEVLDLYVYNNGLVGNNISYSTAVGMLKSLISVTLLFMANGASKLIRHESVF
ncbi:MAG TPA: sugar ABC transporter permease [Candidatus Pelethocola excrementipullorum]|nr:sugar ABC transporter permease [Candidatus Pelethocola excrementipullorum]